MAMFSSWCPWADRKALAHLDAPGVYLLAHFSGNPPKKVAANQKQIIYVGETCDRSIGKRLALFNISASTGKRAHSGGRTYHKRFQRPSKSLYVSIVAVRQNDTGIPSLRIRYLERKFIYQYALQWGKAPLCNKK